MKVTMMLADHAQAVSGKLYLCGGGWSVCGPDPTPCAIALDIKVPWDQKHDEHTVRLELLDADGQPVLVPTPQGVQPLTIEGTFQVSGDLDPAVKEGTPVDVPFAINLGPLMIAPSSRYEWRLYIDGETNDDWRLAFTTRAAAQAA